MIERKIILGFNLSQVISVPHKLHAEIGQETVREAGQRPDNLKYVIKMHPTPCWIVTRGRQVCISARPPCLWKVSLTILSRPKLRCWSSPPNCGLYPNDWNYFQNAWYLATPLFLSQIPVNHQPLSIIPSSHLLDHLLSHTSHVWFLNLVLYHLSLTDPPASKLHFTPHPLTLWEEWINHMIYCSKQ